MGLPLLTLLALLLLREELGVRLLQPRLGLLQLSLRLVLPPLHRLLGGEGLGQRSSAPIQLLLLLRQLTPDWRRRRRVRIDDEQITLGGGGVGREGDGGG